jgi:preprotein translocase subunit SecY|tara:strand:+ start:21253 stop:22530 length:1278 start_codon:yes stop_codon:yes gene_type:complete
MVISNTSTLLRRKLLKVLSALLVIRLSLYIPVPNVDLDIFSTGQAINPLFSFAKTLTGSSFLGLGSLGILPYINASIIIQILTPLFPNLERLQKEEGELGRRQLSRYTRYLTVFWSILLSAAIAFVLVKPVVFNWDYILAGKIILSLTTGSMISMWVAELITEEKIGNGSSLIIFINILGSIPTNLQEVIGNLQNSLLVNNFFVTFGELILIYLFVVFIVVLFQEAYKKIPIVSARQLGFDSLQANTPKTTKVQNSYLPIKVNQGGVMPLVFSSTVATLLFYPLQIFAVSTFGNELSFLPDLLKFYSFALNFILVIFFSCFYAFLILKPQDISKNLSKMAYSIPGIKQGNSTTKYLKQVINRLAFVGGFFLAFLAFFPFILVNFFQFNVFKNITSLLILIGVITDVTSQIRGYLLSKTYEGLKET